jgi:hypothetical protein
MDGLPGEPVEALQQTTTRQLADLAAEERFAIEASPDDVLEER